MRIPKYLALATWIALALTPVCSAQAQLAGDWQGTVAAGEQNFRLVWHVVKAADGSVTSTFDNIDEGAYGIKVKSMALNGSDLTVTIDTVIQANGQDIPIKGILAAKVSADGNGFTGTWTQTDPEQPPADMTMKRVQAAAPTAPPPQLTGDWQGTLSAGAQTFRVAWHVTDAADGSINSTFDNIDEGVFGIKIKSVAIKGSEITMTVDTVIQPNGQDVTVRGNLTGKISADGNEVTGTWNQTDPEQGPADVTLKRATAAPAAAASPQKK
jgi:hypothetical protein